MPGPDQVRGNCTLRQTLSPGAEAVRIMARRCLRRGAGTSTQRGSDRRLEGRPSCWRTELQEARCDRCRRSASNGRGVRRPPKGTWPAGRSQEQATGCSLQRCPKSPSRGCRKATQGTPKVPVGSHKEPSSRPGRVCWGRRSTGPRVADKGARVPVAPRAGPGGRAGGTARARCLPPHRRNRTLRMRDAANAQT